MMEWLDVSDWVSEVEEERWRGCDLNASRRGMRMRTCWQTTSEGMNLEIEFSIYHKHIEKEEGLPSSGRKVFIDVSDLI
jgi:hypothetical protein